MISGDFLARNVSHDQIGLILWEVTALASLRGRHGIPRQIEYLVLLGARICVQIVGNVLFAWVLLLIFDRWGEDR